MCLAALAVSVGASCGAQAAQADRDVAAKAEALARDGNTVQAQHLTSSYLRAHPNSVPVNVVAGELEANRHAWEQAMQCFEAALRTDAKDSPARTGERQAAAALALHLRNTQDSEGALAVLQRAHAAVPEDVPTLVNLAGLAQAMHRWKTAGEAADEALALSPESDRVLYLAASIAFDRGEFAAAVTHYRGFLAQHPDDASAHFGAGRALRMQQKSDEARAELERSIALQPVQTESYYQLGEIAQQAGQDAEARAEYGKTLSRMPSHGGALTGMGMLLYREHDYAAAKDFLEKAVVAAPEYQPAHYHLGLTLRRLNDAAGAERELQTATALAARQQGKGAPVAAQ